MSEPQVSSERKQVPGGGAVGMSVCAHSLLSEGIGLDFGRYQAMKQSDPVEARRCFAQFKDALLRRMQWEDEQLFPAFEGKVGGLAGNVCDRFRAEHERIRGLLGAIELKLDRQDVATDAVEAELELVLGTHNHHEHEAIYPAFEPGTGPGGDK